MFSNQEYNPAHRIHLRSHHFHRTNSMTNGTLPRGHRLDTENSLVYMSLYIGRTYARYPAWAAQKSTV